MAAIQDKLRSYIQDKRVSGLYRLPSERDLASQLNCSRLTISKAMAHLAGEGLIERRHGSGTYIVENSRENKTYNIGICLRNAYHSNEQHFLKMVREVSRAAESQNLHLQIFDNLYEQFDRNPSANSLIKSIDAGVLDGLLMISRMPVEIIARLKGKIPLAAVNFNAFGYMNVPSVCCDYFQAGFIAADYLIRKGHKRIAYYPGQFPDHPEAQMHTSALRAAFMAHGLGSWDAGYTCPFSERPSEAERFSAFLRQTAATAVFCRNDIMSAVCIRMLRELGGRVPDDISIIGQGDYSWGGQPDVPLTTIDTKLDEACGIGLELIRKLAHGDKDVPNITTLTPTLLERASVRNLNA